MTHKNIQSGQLLKEDASHYWGRNIAHRKECL